MASILLGLVLILLLAIFMVFLYCAKMLSEIESADIRELQRNIKIKDNYLHTICSIGYGYEGYGVNMLKKTIDEMVELSERAINCDDNYVIGEDINSGVQYNILMEDVKRK